jgi:hypothetical protein
MATDSKKSSRISSAGRFISFATFTAGRNGGMQVNRDKLHSSREYKQQIEALHQISKLMKAKKA